MAQAVAERWINAGVHGDPHGGRPKLLAFDLDDPGLAASHSAVSRELRSVMETIASGVRPQGKLMLLAEQAQRGR